MMVKEERGKLLVKLIWFQLSSRKESLWRHWSLKFLLCLLWLGSVIWKREKWGHLGGEKWTGGHLRDVNKKRRRRLKWNMVALEEREDRRWPSWSKAAQYNGVFFCLFRNFQILTFVICWHLISVGNAWDTNTFNIEYWSFDDYDWTLPFRSLFWWFRRSGHQPHVI